MNGVETFTKDDFATTDFAKAVLHGYMSDLNAHQSFPLAQMRRLYRVIGILGARSSALCRAEIMREFGMSVEWGSDNKEVTQCSKSSVLQPSSSTKPEEQRT